MWPIFSQSFLQHLFFQLFCAASGNTPQRGWRRPRGRFHIGWLHQVCILISIFWLFKPCPWSHSGYSIRYQTATYANSAFHHWVGKWVAIHRNTRITRWRPLYSRLAWLQGQSPHVWAWTVAWVECRLISDAQRRCSCRYVARGTIYVLRLHLYLLLMIFILWPSGWHPNYNEISSDEPGTQILGCVPLRSRTRERTAAPSPSWLAESGWAGWLG